MHFGEKPVHISNVEKTENWERKYDDDIDNNHDWDDNKPTLYNANDYRIFHNHMFVFLISKFQPAFRQEYRALFKFSSKPDLNKCEQLLYLYL